MDVRVGTRRGGPRRSAAAAAALLVLLAMASAPAGAAGPVIPPETPTASDGSRVLIGGYAVARRGAGVSSFAGTGEPTESEVTAPDGATGRDLGDSSIYGPDNRVRVTPTTVFPARAVVMITRRGAAHCTGWLYGPDIVATAGHCVHSGGRGGAWFTGQLVVFPGRNGASTPYGSCTVRKLYSVSGWTAGANEVFDYGAIKLNCRIGYSTGWFGYWWQSASLAGASTSLNGYPGEKPFGQQWRGDSVPRTVVINQPNQIFYINDSTGGMSGSPVYQRRAIGSTFCGGYCVMGIHTYGFPHGAYPHTRYNHASRMTRSTFNNLQAWRAAS